MEEKTVGEQEKPVEEGVKTRGQHARKAWEEKRKSAGQDISEGKEVPLAEGQLEKNAKKQKMDQEEMVKIDEIKIVPFGPKKPHDRMLSAWAWGTGSAEEFEGYERYEAWGDHGDNVMANYIRRKNLLKRVGLEPKLDDTVGHLIQYHLWPGSSAMDMPPVPIMGTEKDARLMQEWRLFEEAEDARVRLGYLKEICITKRKIGQAY
jgi:hypothetical protein